MDKDKFTVATGCLDSNGTTLTTYNWKDTMIAWSNAWDTVDKVSSDLYKYFTIKDSHIENANVCFQNYKTFCPQYIKDVHFYPKVVKMEFTDGTTTVAKLQDGDEYNKETGMAICILEYIYGSKQYNNTFRHWIKHDEKRKADKTAAEKRAEEEKKVKERQAAKQARKKAARKAQTRQEAIDIQKEAYKQALNEWISEPMPDDEMDDYREWATQMDTSSLHYWEDGEDEDSTEEFCVTSLKPDDE